MIRLKDQGASLGGAGSPGISPDRPQLGHRHLHHSKSSGTLGALPPPSQVVGLQVTNLFVPPAQFNEHWGDFFFPPWHTWKDEVHPSSSSRGDCKPQAKTLPSRLRESPGAKLRIGLSFPWQMVIRKLFREGGTYNNILKVVAGTVFREGLDPMGCSGALRKQWLKAFMGTEAKKFPVSASPLNLSMPELEP